MIGWIEAPVYAGSDISSACHPSSLYEESMTSTQSFMAGKDQVVTLCKLVVSHVKMSTYQILLLSEVVSLREEVTSLKSELLNRNAELYRLRDDNKQFFFFFRVLHTIFSSEWLTVEGCTSRALPDFNICNSTTTFTQIEHAVERYKVRILGQQSSRLIMKHKTYTINDDFWHAISWFMFHGECMVNLINLFSKPSTPVLTWDIPTAKHARQLTIFDPFHFRPCTV